MQCQYFISYLTAKQYCLPSQYKVCCAVIYKLFAFTQNFIMKSLTFRFVVVDDCQKWLDKEQEACGTRTPLYLCYDAQPVTFIVYYITSSKLCVVRFLRMMTLIQISSFAVTLSLTFSFISLQQRINNGKGLKSCKPFYFKLFLICGLFMC